MVFRVLTPTGAQPGSPALKQSDGWAEWLSVAAGQAPAPLPTLLQGAGGEQGQLRGHSVPDWRQIRSPPLLRNAARGGAAGAGRRLATSLTLQEKYQPCSPRERSRSSPCTARFMGPSRLEKIQ